MSSFTRRIERTVVPSQVCHPVLDLDGEPTGKLYANPPRKSNYMGRGSKLGVKNPRDACLLARRRRELTKSTNTQVMS